MIHLTEHGGWIWAAARATSTGASISWLSPFARRSLNTPSSTGVEPMNTYPMDGKCHNAEPGTFNHECGKPATWLGTKASGFASGFCDDCKVHGAERHGFTTWQRIVPRVFECQFCGQRITDDKPCGCGARH
jgi:hypothetical protein